MTAQGFDGFVFLSHNSLDKPAVETLAYALLDAGVQPWLDKWDLVPGRPWQAGITDAIRDAHAVAVCIGEHGMGHVQGPEVEVALVRAWRDESRLVVPVLLPGAAERPELPDFLELRTWVDLRQELTDATVQRLVAAIYGRATGALPSTDVPCPYPGLPPFDEADAPRFFGREDDVTALLSRLAKGERMLTLVGASGSGKSSLMRAGLIPAIRTGQVDGRYDWPIVIMRPGPRPVHALAVQLIGLEGGDTARLDELKDLLGRTASTLSDRIDLWLARAGVEDRHGKPARALLAVDQFEEVFTQAEDAEERRALIDNLLHAVTVAGGRVTVVITLRADFCGRALDHSRTFAEALKRSEDVVLPMAPAQLRAAIQRPALQARARFDSGLVGTLVEAIADQPGDLPLLQFTLRELWRRREGEGRQLTWTAYRQIKGVRGAIAEQAEAFFKDLAENQRRDLRRVLGRLVHVGEGPAVDTRRRATRGELESLGSDSIGPLLDSLIDARLLTAGEDGIEIAHEALIRNWEQLRSWVDGDRTFLHWRERFRVLLAEWQRDPKALPPPALLSEAEHWQRAKSEQGEQLSPEERDFIAAGVDHRRQEAEAEQANVARELAQARDLAREAKALALAQRRAKRWALTGAGFFLILAVILGIEATGPIKREWKLRALTRDLVWAAIPLPSGGEFLMGCVPKDDICNDAGAPMFKLENPRHLAKLPRAFELMKYNVTVAQFRRFTEAHGSIRLTRQPDKSADDSPVVNVDWDESRAFCDFVGARLPTEAEWEYAARGGHPDWIYPWGNEDSPEASEGENDFRLYHLIGVQQWTSTALANYPYDPRDGRENADARSAAPRVVRGGSWDFNPQVLRVSNRYNYSPTNRFNGLGFRCARDASP